MSDPRPRSRRTSQLPLGLKISYTVWVIAWIVLYKQFVGWNHYLWLCHLGNIILAIGLWTENPLILSWQALALLIPDLIWTLDFLIGLTTGQTPLGSAWYMFHPAFPRLQKALALFHLFLPLLLTYCLVRFGYDRRALPLHLGYCWIVFPLSYCVSTETDNINWVLGPFGRVQHVVPPLVYLPVAMIAYVVVLYLPSHWLLRRLFSSEQGRLITPTQPVSSPASDSLLQ